MSEFVFVCVCIVGAINFCEISHKIYKNKDRIKKYIYNKYNGKCYSKYN